MRLRNPIYVPFALVLVVGLALSHRYGWSVLDSLAGRSWQQRGAALQHK
jgi:hypothetical protein